MDDGSSILRMKVPFTWTLDETGVEEGTWESLKIEDALEIRKLRKIQRYLEA